MTGTRAITDTTGIMLVAFVVVSTVTVAGVGVLEYQRAQAPGEFNAAVGASVDGKNLTVHHRGGDSIPARRVEIVSRSNKLRRFSGPAATVVVGDGDGEFEPGERWRWTADEAFGESVTVLLVEAKRQKVVDTAAIVPPSATDVSPPPVEEGAPSATFSISDAEPDPGTVVTFDASNSADPDGAIETYEWDLDGDGSFDATGQTATYEYSDPGTVTVRLRVTDDGGNTDTATHTLTVENPPPTVSIESSCEDLVCSFGADVMDPGGSIADIEWTFGDGESTSGTTPTHEYTTGGSYEVTVTVTDDKGATAIAVATVHPKGRLRFRSGEAVSPNGNGKKTAVQITLENDRGMAVEIVDVAVSISKQNVDVVYENDPQGGPFGTEFYVATTNDGYAESGFRSAYESGTTAELDETATIASGDSATVTISEFGSTRTRCWAWFCWQEFSSKNVPGATVTFEIWLSDGTHRSYEFKT